MAARAAGGTAPSILLFSGKGGVGKTTLSAACALLLARRGLPTLLVSTDPAHSTADVLGTRLGSAPVPVEGALSAVEIDAREAADAHLAGVRATVRASVDPDLVPAVERHLQLARDSPGTLEAAVLDRMAALLEACPDPYARLVFDTAPSGHTLRLLALPELLTAWIDGLARQRERVSDRDRMLANLVGEAPEGGSDPLLERLRARRALLREASRRLREDAAIWLVTTPERLAIEETERTSRSLEAAGLPVAGLVVNRVLPPEADGDFLAARRAQEAAHLDELARRFPRSRQVMVLQQPGEVTSRAELGLLADQLAAGGLA